MSKKAIAANGAFLGGLLLLLCASCPSPSHAALLPKCEVRAVWIATAAGLDWPHSVDPAEQQASLRRMIAYLKEAHFNTIFFQVRARGDAYYRSSYDPWAENLTGTFGQNPGWDPLAFLLREAHAAGLEVHAWFNVYKTRSGIPAITPPQYPPAMPRWIVPYRREAWLDPGIPAVTEYVLATALELVRNYDIDGINFDYARYPGKDFPDADTYRRYGRGLPRDDWRRHNITAFISRFYDRAIAIRPMLKIGSSPVGVYKDAGGIEGSYSAYYQDAQGWLRAGKQDYLSPQIYWSLQEPPGRPNFTELLRQWSEETFGRQIYAGIGAYRAEVARALPAILDSARARPIQGEAFFRFENVSDSRILDRRFATLANLPPMPWKDSIPPLPPTNLAVTELERGIFQLEWTPPAPAADGDTARYYDIYRFSSPEIPFDNPRSIVAITASDRNFYIDTVRGVAGVTTYFAVSAFDKGNNESAPSNVSSGVYRELVALKRKLVNFTSLSASIDHAPGAPNFISYKLANRTRVSLTISMIREDGSDTLWTRLVEGTQDGGTYVVGLGADRFKPGRYIIRLSAGENTLEQPIELPR